MVKSEEIWISINKLLIVFEHVINTTIDAPVPSNLIYSAKQQRYFSSPQDHENTFVRLLQDPEYNQCLRGDKIKSDEISDNYIVHFQTMMQLMHTACVDSKPCKQVCDIAGTEIEITDQTVELHVIDIRPCAQKLGIFNLIICQLLNSCRCVHKSFVVVAPVPETLDALVSIFNGIGMYKQVRYTIPIEKFETWDASTCLQICRLDETRNHSFDDANVIVVNPRCLPTAHEMNDQREVDNRFNSSKSRLSRDRE